MNVAFQPPLRISDLLGGLVVLQPGQEATVGRAGSFPVGTDDMFLHRVLFQVWYGGQGWLLRNHSPYLTITIEVRSTRTRTRFSAGPGATIQLSLGPSAVVFTTPERVYELHIDIPSTGVVPPQPVETEVEGDETTARRPPTEEQRQLLDVLAAPLLRNPGTPDSAVPTVREVAAQLGWTEKKTHQKIDRFCARLAEDGEGVYKPYRLFLAHYGANRKKN